MCLRSRKPYELPLRVRDLCLTLIFLALALSRTTRNCTAVPALITNTANFGKYANPLVVQFNFTQTPSVVSLALSPTGSCTVSGLTATATPNRYTFNCAVSSSPTPISTGVLTGIVTVDGALSASAQLANVVPPPRPTQTYFKIATNASVVEFTGSQFGSINADLNVQLLMDPDTRACTVTFSNDTAIRCTPGGLLYVNRDLKVKVLRAGGEDIGALAGGYTIAKVVSPPVLTTVVTSQAPTNRSLTISGTFNVNASNDGTNNIADYPVTLIQTSGSQIPCVTTSISATRLTCTASADLEFGTLRAFVSYFGGFSNTVQIRTVRGLPLITSTAPPTIAVNSSTAVVAICGQNFASLAQEHRIYLYRENGGSTVASADSIEVGDPTSCLRLNIASAPGRIFGLVEVLGVGLSNNVTITEAVLYPFLYSPADTVRRTTAERYTAPTGKTFLSGANLLPTGNWTLETYIYNGIFDQEQISAGTINFTTIHLGGSPGVSRACNGLTVLANDFARCDFGLAAGDLNKTVYGRIVSPAAPDLGYEYITQVVPPPTITPATSKMAETTFEISITGSGFNPTKTQNKAHFLVGGTVVASAYAQSGGVAGPNNLEFLFPYDTFVGKTGALSASIETYGVNTTATAVYVIVPAPRINNSTLMTIARGSPKLTIRGSNFPTGEPSLNAVVQVYFEEPSSGASFSVSQDSNATHLVLENLAGLNPGPLQAAVVIYDGPNLKKRAEEAVDPELLLVGLRYYTIGNVVPTANITTRGRLWPVGFNTIRFRCTNCETNTNVALTVRCGIDDITPTITSATTISGSEVEVAFTGNFSNPGDVKVRITAFGAQSEEANIGAVTAAPFDDFQAAPQDIGGVPVKPAAPGSVSLTPDGSSSQGGPNVGGIVAGVIIAVLVVVGAIIAVVIILKRKKKSGAALARASIPPRMDGDGDGASVWDGEGDGEQMAPTGGNGNGNGNGADDS